MPATALEETHALPEGALLHPAFELPLVRSRCDSGNRRTESTASPHRARGVAFHRMMERAGVDTEWAWGSPGRLVDVGLVDVGAEFDGEIFRGGSALAQFWSLTWLQVRERIMASGSLGEVVDDGRAALDDASRWFHGPATVIAWGRRPAG